MPDVGVADLPRLGPLRTVCTDLLEIAYVDAGPASGPVTVLLHGFPYDIHSFVDVIPPLVDDGQRVIVPYLRGHGPTRFLDPGTARSGQQAALGADYVTLLGNANENVDQQDRYIETFLNQRVDGVVLAPQGRGSGSLQALVDSRMPVVFVAARPGATTAPTRILRASVKVAFERQMLATKIRPNSMMAKIRKTNGAAVRANSTAAAPRCSRMGARKARGRTPAALLPHLMRKFDRRPGIGIGRPAY